MTVCELMMAKVSRPLRSFSLHWSRRFSGSEYLLENSHSGTLRVVHGRENSSKGMQVQAMWLSSKSGAICAGAAHSQRGGDCDCTLVFVQRGRIRFHYKAPPPVERVESIMTSLAGSLGGNATAQLPTDHNCLGHPHILIFT